MSVKMCIKNLERLGQKGNIPVYDETDYFEKNLVIGEGFINDVFMSIVKNYFTVKLKVMKSAKILSTCISPDYSIIIDYVDMSNPICRDFDIPSKAVIWFVKD